MKLSIIVPAYNEENTIGLVIDRLSKTKLPVPFEVVIIDDGSTDNTPKIIKENAPKLRHLKVIRHPHNQGKGAGIITGIKHANGDYLLIQDADLEYNPAEIPSLLGPILNRQTADNRSLDTELAVYGSRFKSGNFRISLLYYLGNRFLTFITNVLFGTNLTDMETCYKLIPGKVFKDITLSCRGFEIEPEITIALIKKRIPITEIPISYISRSHFMGKKISLKDAVFALLLLLRKRYSSNGSNGA